MTVTLAPKQGAAGDALVLRAYQRCEWYELALMRHGFTVERLQRLSRKVANDALRLRGATLGDRFEDLVSRLQMVGLQAAIRYDPQRHHSSYGSNGGEPFASYVADLMGKRVDDYFRSKAEGFGDRRYGNDNRVVLAGDLSDRGTRSSRKTRRELLDDDHREWDRIRDEDPTARGEVLLDPSEIDPADHDTDFEDLVDDRRRAQWQAAADKVGWPLSEWVAITLDRAARDVRQSAA